MPYGGAVGSVTGPNEPQSTIIRVPKRLEPGDRVRIVAPGSPVSAPLLAGGVAVLESWGLKVQLGRSVLAAADPPLSHLAGADVDRAADLVSALVDPEISAVFCARGGTGAGRTLEFVSSDEWQRIAAATPRWFIGSSDATAIHLAVLRRAGWTTMFGPMPATEIFGGSDRDDTSLVALKRSLCGTATPQRLTGRTLAGDSPVRAPALGGTITLIQSLLGTRDAGAARDHVVLLEDVGEAPRRLDRALTQLRRSGWLEGARAVLVGSLVDCGATGAEVVGERLSDLGVPVIVDLPLGHGRPQRSLPFGMPINVDPIQATVSW